MRKYFVYSIACALATIPDVLSLSAQVTYLASGLLAALVFIALGYNSVFTDARANRCVDTGILLVTFCLSISMSIYRFASDSTLTLDFAPQVAEAASELVGAQARLEAIHLRNQVRLVARERIAVLETELAELESENRELESILQRYEPKSPSGSHNIMERSRSEIEKAYTGAENAIMASLHPRAFSASTAFPSYIGEHKTAELEKWSDASVRQLEFYTDPVFLRITTGRSRNLSVRADVLSRYGRKIWSFEREVKEDDLEEFPSGNWSLVLPIGRIALPGHKLETDAYLFCTVIEDLDSGKILSMSTVANFELIYSKIESFLKVVNVLPYRWEYAGALDKSDFAANIELFCGDI